MMLRRGNNHFIAFSDERLPEREGHQINGCRGTGGKHNFLPTGRVDERLNAVASAFIGLRSDTCQIMDGTMNVRISRQHGLRPGIYYRLRAHGGGSVVQIHQRLAVHVCGKGGELFANLFYHIFG